MRLEHISSIVTFVVMTGIACVSSQVNAATPEKLPLGKDLDSYEASGRPPGENDMEPPSLEEPTGVLNLRKVLALALMRNPRLKAFAWGVRAKEARTLQAGLLPNPEIIVEFENFEGSGDFKGNNVTESTLQLSQLIELGGKRMKRVKVAGFEQKLAAWDYEKVRIETLTKVTKAFVSVLSSQERVALTGKLVGLAIDALTVASERVAAGKTAPIDEIRAKVELSVSKIDLEVAKRGLTAARKRLSSLWGSDKTLFEKAEGSLDDLKPVPSAKAVERLIPYSPDVARWDAELKRYKSAVALEWAGRIPNLTLQGGMRNFRDTNDNAFVFGMSMPLPVFNRNQGAYLEARFNLARAKEERRGVVARVRSALVDSYRDLSSSYEEASALKGDVLPGARIAFETAKEGYLLGKFGYLEVLDAQRVLFETRGRYIDVLAKYHKAAAEIEQLTGSPLEIARREIKAGNGDK